MCGERRGKSCLGKVVFILQRTEMEIKRDLGGGNGKSTILLNTRTTEKLT